MLAITTPTGKSKGCCDKMGHYYTKIVGIGKDEDDARSIAIYEFLYEHGRRHNVREVKTLRLVELVPPKKEKRVDCANGDVLISSEPDPTAPKEEWLQKWEFEIHSHA